MTRVTGTRSADLTAVLRLAATRVLVLPTLLLLLPACQTMTPRGAAPQLAVPTDGNGALMDYIADQAYVTVEPAYRAVYILWRNEIYAGGFAELTEELRAAGIVKREWDYPPDAVLDRASVGYMICKAARVRSGLNWQLTGLGRYAWRELNYLGIASPISEYGYVPGGQFIGVLARAEEYMHKSGTAPGPADLGHAP